MIKGEVTAGAQAFAAAARWAAKFVSGKPAVPVQGGLLLDVEDGRLSILGYNETATARAVIDVQGSGGGQVVVSARLLAALAATFPNKPIRISGPASGEPIINLAVGSWCGTLPAIIEGEFSSPPPPPPTIGRVRGDDLARAVRQVATAASSDDKQAAIYHCAHLSFGDQQLAALATNMYRAAQAKIGFDSGPEGDRSERTALVHAGTLDDVAESMTGPDDVWIGLDEHSIGFATATRAVILRQHAEPYAPLAAMRKLFALEHPQHALVTAGDLQVPMKRAQLMRDKEGPIRVRFAEDAITLAASNEQLHQDSAETVVAQYSGPEHEMKFNPGYFAEALAGAPGESVDIALTTERPAAVILTVPGNEDWRHALMPLR